MDSTGEPAGQDPKGEGSQMAKPEVQEPKPEKTDPGVKSESQNEPGEGDLRAEKGLTPESSMESENPEDGKRSRRTAAINQRLLMKKIASQEPNIESNPGETLEDEDELARKRKKKEAKKRMGKNFKPFNTLFGAPFGPGAEAMAWQHQMGSQQQFFGAQPMMYNSAGFYAPTGDPNYQPDYGYAPPTFSNATSFNGSAEYNGSGSLEGAVPSEEQFDDQDAYETPGSGEEVLPEVLANPGQIYNFNEHEYLVKVKKKKVLVNKDQYFEKGLKYIENNLTLNTQLREGGLEALWKMALKNLELDPVYFVQLGGEYEELQDDVGAVNKVIEALQADLGSLHTQMGKTQLSRLSEPAVIFCSPNYTINTKDKSLEYEDVLEEMKDFQDLVNDEHKEKRRLFKNLIMGTSKHILKMELEMQKSKTERSKQVLVLYKNMSNMIDLFWKKIEKFAWEHLKKDLQQELMRKKKQNLDKFIQDAIKVSINDQDRYILNQKIKGTTSQAPAHHHEEDGSVLSSPEKRSLKSERTKAAKLNGVAKNQEVDEELLEDEYVFGKDEEKIELEDLKLEDEMESDKEENELNDLQKDLEMPLEELLKMYQRAPGDQDPDGDVYYDSTSESAHESQPDNGDDSAETGVDEVKMEPEKSDETLNSPRKGTCSGDAHVHGGLKARDPSPRTSRKKWEKEVKDESPGPEDGGEALDQGREDASSTTVETKSADKDQEVDEELLEDEYVFGKDEEKIELEDLKLEDEMESDKEENELNDLQKDLEMPLEELLKMYQRAPGDQDPDGDVYYDSTSESAHESQHDNKDGDDMKVDKDEATEKGATSEASLQGAAKDAAGMGDVKIPFLIRAVLRPYQREGLGWLVSLYQRGINGVLADEMGLGKTLQTISLLAYLACYEGNWGPHIIIVPTSILLNWVMEFNRFCPGFKLLAYYGTPAERAKKRVGWSRPYSFNVLISSYSTVVQDAYMLKRRAWEYMILDEAQNIKNFHSKRWQTLLTFNTKYRLLLTGTPLQNSLQELWSLMHFILPNIFTSHTQFNIWFTDPLNQALDNLYSSNPLYKDSEEADKEKREKEEMNRNNMELVEKLHVIFRPYLLRRLKKDVEKQMPSKYEHVLKCTLTKRQQVLYDEFITLYNLSSKDGHGAREGMSYRSMLNILMQLRKICNHPNQLRSRDIQIPIEFNIETVQLPFMFNLTDGAAFNAVLRPRSHGSLKEVTQERNKGPLEETVLDVGAQMDMATLRPGRDRLIVDSRVKRRRLEVNPNSHYLLHYAAVSDPDTGDIGRHFAFTHHHTGSAPASADNGPESLGWGGSPKHADSLGRLKNIGMETLLAREDSVFDLKLRNNLEMNKLIEPYLPLVLNFLVIATKVVSRPARLFFSGAAGVNYNNRQHWHMRELSSKLLTRDDKAYYATNRVTLEAVNSHYRLLFPSKRALNDDCGKFRVLGPLLLRLRSEGHRCIVYTQFSKMLDILENWINFMGFTYTRLDGSTKIDMRQKIINRFNENTKIFLFISSTRTGGVGITLTGADTVIFYDTDWNPAIDRQAMDRCHRIGQTKDVNVYRLISEHTVEENIWRKQLQKRKLDDLIVDQGQFDIQHNWFSNIDTLINIFQNKREEGEEEDIYGRKVLHESNVDEANYKPTGVQSLKMLIEVEDADDSMALQKLTKENERINKQDFEGDIINSIPGLVTYCIKFLLRYQTVALVKQVETMKLKIQVEDYQHKQGEEEEEEEEDEEDLYTDYTTSEEGEEGQEGEEEEMSQE